MRFSLPWSVRMPGWSLIKQSNHVCLVLLTRASSIRRAQHKRLVALSDNIPWQKELCVLSISATFLLTKGSNTSSWESAV